jgi:hypothetical protein
MKYCKKRPMNIFILDRNIRKCARYHADQHVVKMILESAQMLCTVVNLDDGEAPYKSTHVKHPCTQWVGESLANWHWLRRLALALNDEYRYRYPVSKDHKSALVIRSLSPPKIDDIGLTEFALAMPDKYIVSGDAIQSYRNFYIGEKARFVRWTRRRLPRWFKEGMRGCP